MGKTTTEYWRYIPGFDFRYQVSGNGLVRRLKLTPDGVTYRPMTQSKNPVSGYLTVTLSRNGKVKKEYVHRLVLMSFRGFPRKGIVCCHNDGNPENNRLDNLRWDTQKANCEDRAKHGVWHASLKRNPAGACRRGHKLVGHNLIETPTPTGKVRNCRACAHARQRARYHGVKPTTELFADAYARVLAHDGK